MEHEIKISIGKGECHPKKGEYVEASDGEIILVQQDWHVYKARKVFSAVNITVPDGVVRMEYHFVDRDGNKIMHGGADIEDRAVK